jgi:hypothetical protein
MRRFSSGTGAELRKRAAVRQRVSVALDVTANLVKIASGRKKGYADART